MKKFVCCPVADTTGFISMGDCTHNLPYPCPAPDENLVCLNCTSAQWEEVQECIFCKAISPAKDWEEAASPGDWPCCPNCRSV